MLTLRCEEFAFQLTACIGILNPARRRRDGVKEGGSIKSQECILCKYKIGVVSMKIVIGRCYVNFLQDYHVQKTNLFSLFCFSVGR
jgi:hypothetical protein